ncbi:MAG: decaprenyl-phosphate phosphoribosyltransferase [Candidatus Omnitrophica bacterium]|nr:decaprenyl-phosphate phosphoribosyltransferase [Candidatus Omnitrophota bacterium]
MKNFLYSIRPRQWIKNSFILLPLIFGKKLFSYPANLDAVIAMVLFSMTSGAVYLFNDLIDVRNDRVHPLKKFRPIASGKLSIANALIAAIILSFLSIGLAFVLNRYLGLVMLIYLLFNLIYTKVLKNFVIVDVFCVGGFFLLRIIAGSVATGIEMSHWIILMTVLLALFLGFIKRRQELIILQKKAVLHRKVLSKYSVYFIDQMIAVLTSSMVVIYMLYTVDTRTINAFGSNHLMYSLPFVYYGIFRYLYIIHQRFKHGDPTRILFADLKLQLNLALWCIVCILVIYFGI